MGGGAALVAIMLGMRVDDTYVYVWYCKAANGARLATFDVSWAHRYGVSCLVVVERLC